MKKLMKQLLALGLCTVMVFCMCSTQILAEEAEEYEKTEVWHLVDSDVNCMVRIYTEPDVDSIVLKVIHDKTTVTVLETNYKDGWIKISYNEIVGYIHNESKQAEEEKSEGIELTEEATEIIENTEEIAEETLVCTGETDVSAEEIIEEVPEEFEEETEIPVEEVTEEIIEEVPEEFEEETEIPVEEVTEEIIEEVPEEFEEETDVSAEEIIEEVPEEFEEETEIPAEEVTEEIIEEVPEEFEEGTEIPEEEIFEEINDEVTEESETETEASEEEILEEIAEEVFETAKEKTITFDVENPDEVSEEEEEKTTEFGGIIEECNEIAIQEAETESEEIAEETVQFFEPPTVNIWWDAKPVLLLGEPVTLFSQIENPAGYDMTYQWQCDSGEGYEDIQDANDKTYTFPASAELLSYYWRLKIDYGVGIVYVE